MPATIPDVNIRHAKFSTIETRAVMANGKIVTSHRSYPLGATYEEYRKIDSDLVKSFGNNGSKTTGTIVSKVVVEMTH